MNIENKVNDNLGQNGKKNEEKTSPDNVKGKNAYPQGVKIVTVRWEITSIF